MFAFMAVRLYRSAMAININMKDFPHEGIKVSLHTSEPDATAPTTEPTEVQDLSWSSAAPVTIKTVTIGGEMFVTPDWNAYDQGYAAGLSAARDAVDVALLGTLQTTRDRALAAIDALRGEA